MCICIHIFTQFSLFNSIILKLRKEERKNEKETFEWKKHKNNKKIYKQNESESEVIQANKCVYKPNGYFPKIN